MTASADDDEEGAAATSLEPKLLVPYMKRVPVRRVVHLPATPANEVTFMLSHAAGPDGQLPLAPGMAGPQLGSWTVGGLQDVLKQYNDTGRVSVHFRSVLLLFPWLCARPPSPLSLRFKSCRLAFTSGLLNLGFVSACPELGSWPVGGL